MMGRVHFGRAAPTLALSLKGEETRRPCHTASLPLQGEGWGGGERSHNPSNVNTPQQGVG